MSVSLSSTSSALILSGVIDESLCAGLRRRCCTNALPRRDSLCVVRCPDRADCQWPTQQIATDRHRGAVVLVYIVTGVG